MALDTWLEADIKAFLDHEMTQETTPTVARLEDTEAMYANIDWRHEIRDRVAQGDTDGAKQLFAQLRLKYASIPVAHEQERAKLYETMQDCYVAIANRVLDDWHTRELLKHMEGEAENIFDPRSKPIDLSKPFLEARSNVPDVPQLTKTLVGHAPQFRAIQHEEPSMPPPDADAFSFEPQKLMRVAADATTNERITQTPASALQKTAQTPLASNHNADVLRQAIALATTNPSGAHALLVPLTTPNTPENVRKQAAQLLAALEPHLAPKQSPPPAPEPPQQKTPPHENEKLIMARAAAAAYERVASTIDNELVTTGILARSHNRAGAENALARAAVALDTLAALYPAVAAPLRERLERTAHTFALAAPSPGAAVLPPPQPVASFNSTPLPSALVSAAHAVRAAALAHDARAFAAALTALESAARTLPPPQRAIISEAIAAVRHRTADTVPRGTITPW